MDNLEIFKKALLERYEKSVYEKLTNARVAIAGLGGLGSNVAVSLARAGVGTLHILDFDNVDVTNLNRQHYRVCDIGKPKTSVLPEIIYEINPLTKIIADNVRLDEDNLLKYLEDDYIICEAFDKPNAKAMLVNTLLENRDDIKLVCASGMAGYGKSNNIETKKLSDNFYICGDRVTESSPKNGLMSPRVNLCAAHEANKILEFILDKGD